MREICANCAYYIRYQLDPSYGHCNGGGSEHGYNKEPDDSCQRFEPTSESQ